MTTLRQIAGLGAAALTVAVTGACSSGLGNVLGSVLGGGGQQQQQSGQLTGTIRAVNANSQQITIQQSNGQSVAVYYDNQTQVVYQNQRYSVSNLEYGDRVTASVRQAQNGYYTDYVQVDQSVSTSGGSGASGNVQSIQGNVRQIDSRNGLFTVESGNGLVTVAMPYNPRSADVSRFQNLRSGDFVRFYGVYLNNSRVELRQFY
jgi:Cu/Ag efflux protein CusF